MTTDLRYALKQLRPIVAVIPGPPMSRMDISDRVQRAVDALESLLERAPAYEAAFDAALEAQEEAEAEKRRQACIGANLPAGFVDRWSVEDVLRREG